MVIFVVKIKDGKVYLLLFNIYKDKWIKENKNKFIDTLYYDSTDWLEYKYNELEDQLNKMTKLRFNKLKWHSNGIHITVYVTKLLD